MEFNDLKGRMKAFALRVMELADSLPQTPSSRVVSNQIAKSGTSVAANYRAACRARSKPEFIAKMSIVHEEADETLFWIELIESAGWIAHECLQDLKKEADELVAIVVTSLKTAKKSSQS